MSPLSTTSSASERRIRCSAAMPVLASSGEAAVNWMSESVAKDQSPPVLPSGENIGSSRSGSSGGLGTSTALSTSSLSKITAPSACRETLVSMTWNAETRIGNRTPAGSVHS